MAPALRAAAWSGGWGKLDLSLPPSSTSTSPSLETETRAQETARHVRQNRGSQDGSDPHARVLAALHGLLPLQPRHRPPARQPPLTRHHSRNAPRPSLPVRPHLHLQAHSPQSPASLSPDSSNTLFTARWPPRYPASPLLLPGDLSTSPLPCGSHTFLLSLPYASAPLGRHPVPPPQQTLTCPSAPTWQITSGNPARAPGESQRFLRFLWLLAPSTPTAPASASRSALCRPCG